MMSRAPIETWPGRPYPLGRRLRRRRARTSRCSPRSPRRVELCLFDDDGSRERLRRSRRSTPPAGTATSRRQPGPALRLPGARAVGPGARPALQPGQAAARPVRQGDRGRGAAGTRPASPTPSATSDARNDDDSAPFMPQVGRASTRTSTGATTGRPDVPLNETVIYEMHVKGFTAAPPGHPGAPARHLRRPRPPGRRSSTSPGSASPPSSCCPCTSSCTTSHLVERGLRNYWGYNSIGFLAPHNDYAAAGQRGEQVAGVQGDGQGPARGRHRGDPRRRLQPHRRGQPPRARCCRSRASTTPAYYRLVDDEPRFYYDYTGHRQQPQRAPPARAAADHGLACATGSLEMHVDGFRFDLAASLARQFHEVDRLSAFFDLIQQDPVVSQVKLIAEPWDVGEGGYQVGNFPPCGRSGTAGTATPSATSGAASRRTLGEFAYRLTGSSDLYEADRRGVRTPASTSSPPTTGSRCATSSPTTRSTTRPTARTGRDGDERQPVVELRRRRRRPTTRESWRCGAGSSATSSPRCCCPRACPMLLGGDEFGRTQGGNNNAYCQDNEISWYDWERADDAVCSASPSA